MILFRKLVLMLMLAAPGQVVCDQALYRATVCWITFHNPTYTEEIRPGQTGRILRLAEVARAENK